MKNVLVIGGTGLIGKEVISKLATSGIDIYLVTRNLGKAPAYTIPIRADIASFDWAQSCSKMISQVDAIIYMAYSTSSDAAYDRRVNFEGLKEIVSAVKTERLIFLSTIGVFGSSSKDGEYTENSPKIIDSIYVKDKIDAENFLAGCNSIPRRTVLYISNAYELGSSRIKYYSSLLKLGYFVYKKNGNGIYNVVHSSDAADAVILSMNTENGTEFNSYIVNGEYIKHREFSAAIEEYFEYAKKPRLPSFLAPVFKWHIKKIPAIFGFRAPLRITEPKATLFEAGIFFSNKKIMTELKWLPKKNVKNIIKK